MRSLPQNFQAACDTAFALAAAGERVRAAGGAIAREQLTVHRLEYLYEIAFLRIFIAWEDFLEESFVRYMCGFGGTAGRAARLGGAAYFPTISAAKAALYGTHQYLLWHSPKTIIARSKGYFSAGFHETVLLSNQTRVDWFSNVRHRVAHGQEDAQKKFDVATMSLNGRRYRASRVGRFLRDSDTSQTPPVRWLESIASELAALAFQVVP